MGIVVAEVDTVKYLAILDATFAKLTEAGWVLPDWLLITHERIKEES